MPYKDSQRKKDWERLHRPQRLARRRELRRIAMARNETHPEVQSEAPGEVSFLLPLVTGGILAACKPKVAIGAGGLTLAIAAIYKKGWSWWTVGILMLALGVYFYWSDQNDRNAQKTQGRGQNQ